MTPVLPLPTLPPVDSVIESFSMKSSALTFFNVSGFKTISTVWFINPIIVISIEILSSNDPISNVKASVELSPSPTNRCLTFTSFPLTLTLIPEIRFPILNVNVSSFLSFVSFNLLSFCKKSPAIDVSVVPGLNTFCSIV